MHRRIGDVQVHAVGNKDEKDTHDRWRQIRTRISAARAAAELPESPLLRLDGIELTHNARSRQMAGVAVSGLTDSITRRWGVFV